MLNSTTWVGQVLYSLDNNYNFQRLWNYNDFFTNHTYGQTILFNTAELLRDCQATQFFPTHLPGHWILVVIIWPKKRIEVYDSLNRPRPMHSASKFYANGQRFACPAWCRSWRTWMDYSWLPLGNPYSAEFFWLWSSCHLECLLYVYRKAFVCSSTIV